MSEECECEPPFPDVEFGREFHEIGCPAVEDAVPNAGSEG